MRDLKQLPGKKIRVESFDEALFLVRKQFSSTYSFGSLGSWSFWEHREGKEPVLVGEMWVLPGRHPGWWLRIKDV